jgi:hypothetical protein
LPAMPEAVRGKVKAAARRQTSGCMATKGVTFRLDCNRGKSDKVLTAVLD